MKDFLVFCHELCSVMITNAQETSSEWAPGTWDNVHSVGWGCPLDAPIRSISDGVIGEYLGYINYFLPLAEFGGILPVWVASVLGYYIVSIAMRWAKAIS